MEQRTKTILVGAGVGLGLMFLWKRSKASASELKPAERGPVLTSPPIGPPPKTSPLPPVVTGPIGPTGSKAGPDVIFGPENPDAPIGAKGLPMDPEPAGPGDDFFEDTSFGPGEKQLIVEEEEPGIFDMFGFD